MIYTYPTTSKRSLFSRAFPMLSGLITALGMTFVWDPTIREH